MRLPRALRTASFRLAALYVLLFAASVLLLGMVVFWTIRGALERQMAARIEAEAAALQAEYQVGGIARVVASVQARGRGPVALDYRLEAADGRRLAGEIPELHQQFGWTEVAVAEEHPPIGPSDADAPERLKVLVVPLGQDGRLAVGDDVARIEEVEEAVLLAFGGTLGLVALLGASGGVLLSVGFLRRVDAISRTADAIIDGDLTRRIPVRGTGDDLDRLAQTLNHMLDRIAALMESVRQVSSDVAHDLRTPLSRLCQRLDAARSQARSMADYQQAVEGALADTESILDTFSALLRIAQIEAGSRRAQFRAVNMSRLVQAAVDDFRPAAEDLGQQLSGTVPPVIIIVGDQELLTQMVINLIENALRHPPRGTLISVSLSQAGGRVRLSVTDNGPGVPANTRTRIFERFYRCEPSRGEPGSGLGLSLVAAIADLHRASYVAEDAKPGLRIVVDFAAGRAG